MTCRGRHILSEAFLRKHLSILSFRNIGTVDGIVGERFFHSGTKQAKQIYPLTNRTKCDTISVKAVMETVASPNIQREGRLLKVLYGTGCVNTTPEPQRRTGNEVSADASPT